MRYAASRYEKERRDSAYRIYVSECLRMISENSAKLTSMLGRGDVEAAYMSLKRDDILTPTKKRALREGEPTESIRRKLRG